MQMLRLSLLLLSSICVFAQAPRPKLVVLIAVDQFRADYLTRFRPLYNDGLDKLLREGAVFTNALHTHYLTTTAPGHAAMLTGASPAVTGIVANEWYDRVEKRQVSSVSDYKAILLGATGVAASPLRLLAPTIGDVLKSTSASKVIGISMKDRGAILPAGRKADAAYWYDTSNGNFVSSTYYFPALPAWASQFNANRAADQFAGKEWRALDGSRTFTTLDTTPSKAYWTAVYNTPFGNELLEQFAETAIEAEQLGKRGATDLLIVSFSSNDPIGHSNGPDSDQVKDVSVRTDRIFGKFFRYLDAKLGLQNVVIVLTSDHGVARAPQLQVAERIMAGRLGVASANNKVSSRLFSLYGPGKWILGNALPNGDFYLNRELIATKKLDLRVVREKAAAAAREIPHIARVYTWDQLNAGIPITDEIARRVVNGWNPERSPDVILIPARNWFFSKDVASHGTPYDYDAHVPLIFMGVAFKPGQYGQNVSTYSLAPTLAEALGIPAPEKSQGEVLPILR
jgi:predicted AlkP superfamily pyrophosphatase or phosphodiesterase